MNTTYILSDEDKQPVWQLDSTLEERVLEGYTQVGNIGTSFTYKVAETLSLCWRVRVLSEDYELIERAPYSLAFASSCCETSLREHDDAEEGLYFCRDCEAPQPWIPTDGPLSLLGAGRVYSLQHLEFALSYLHELNPLEAALAAQHVVADIEQVHAKYMTPEWARECANRANEKYHRPLL